MTEKYSLLPINPQQLTPEQTALQRLSQKHPDFEIQPVNTIRPPEIENMLFLFRIDTQKDKDRDKLENVFLHNLTLIKL